MFLQALACFHHCSFRLLSLCGLRNQAYPIALSAGWPLWIQNPSSRSITIDSSAWPAPVNPGSSLVPLYENTRPAHLLTWAPDLTAQGLHQQNSHGHSQTLWKAVWWRAFFCWNQSLNTGRGTHFLKCADPKVRLQGSWFKETRYSIRKLIKHNDLPYPIPNWHLWIDSGEKLACLTWAVFSCWIGDWKMPGLGCQLPAVLSALPNKSVYFSLPFCVLLGFSLVFFPGPIIVFNWEEKGGKSKLFCPYQKPSNTSFPTIEVWYPYHRIQI